MATERTGKLLWDQVGQRIYETGDRNVALYVYESTASTPTGATAATHYPQGVAWNGITAITESPSGAEATDLWADDTKYATLRSAEQLGGTIEAYTYPDEWMQCIGFASPIKGISLSQQKRRSFGLAFITTVGNDAELNDFGEKLHLIYNASASTAERSYATINDSPEAITFSWEFTTTPIDVGTVNDVEYKQLSEITLDTSKFVNSDGTVDTELLDKYNAFKQLVFGNDGAGGVGAITPHLPEPAAVLQYFSSSSHYRYVPVGGLTTEPDDWDTEFMDYYKKTGSGEYTRVGDQPGGAPTFESGVYYRREYVSD